MGSFLFCFFPCLCFLPRPLVRKESKERKYGKQEISRRRCCKAARRRDRQAHRPLCARQRDFWIWMTAKAGLCRERPSGRKLQCGQDELFLQNGHIKCPSQEVPARGRERIQYLFFCMTATAVVGIIGVMLLTTRGIGATYACTFLFLFSDVEQCCTNNNYH